MKVSLIKDGLVMLDNGNSFPIPFWDEEDRLALFMVRHADKGEGSDPDLLPNGRMRALKLSNALKGIELAGCYVTNTARTLQTAMPLAEQKQIPVKRYSPLLQIPMVREMKERAVNENVLIVGHLNTIPELINYVVGKKELSNIPYYMYDHLFIVVWRKCGNAHLLQLKY